MSTGDQTDWRRAAARRLLIPLAIGVVGLVVYLVGSSDTVRIVGSGILGLAAIVVVALAFLEVGYSEDRARARELTDANRAGRRRSGS